MHAKTFLKVNWAQNGISTIEVPAVQVQCISRSREPVERNRQEKGEGLSQTSLKKTRKNQKWRIFKNLLSVFLIPALTEHIQKSLWFKIPG
jgi:hypothetical protein